MVLEPIHELRGDPPLLYAARFILVLSREDMLSHQHFFGTLYIFKGLNFVLVTLPLKTTMKKNCPDQISLKLKIVY